MRRWRIPLLGLALVGALAAGLAQGRVAEVQRGLRTFELRTRVEAAVASIDLPAIPNGSPAERVEAYLAGLMRTTLAERFGLSARMRRPGPPEPADREYALSVVEAEGRLAHKIQAAGEPLVSILLMTVSDEAMDFGARCVAMRLLEIVSPDRLEPELARVARDGRYGIALFEALVSLGRIHDPRGAGPLLDALTRLRGWGRQYAIVGLKLLGERHQVSKVMACLEDPEPAVRRHAAMYLAASGDPQGRLAVLSLGQTDPDPTTRLVAQFSLRPIAMYPCRDLGLVKDLRSLLKPRRRPVSPDFMLDTIEMLH